MNETRAPTYSQLPGGRWRAEVRDVRDVYHYADGDTQEDAEAQLSRSYQLNGVPKGEIAYADPFRLFPNQIAQYNPSLLVQRRGLRIFDQMRRDDQVKAALTFKKHAVFASGWRVDSPEGKPDDWEPTVFIREQLENLEGTFAAELLEILTALDFGFSVSEKVFEEAEGQIQLRAIKTIAPHPIEFNVDRHGNLLPNGILQWQNERGLVKMPRDKFVVFKNMSEFSNPYGTSDLDAAYRAWWTKDNSYKWLAMMLERYGIPPIFAKYQAGTLNPEQVNQLKNVLSNMQAATAAMIPFSDDPNEIEFWAPNLAGEATRAFEPSIAMFNTDIARAILMPGLLGITPEGQVGSMARARIVFDVFMFVRDFLADQISDVCVNDQIVRPLIQFNYPLEQKELPIFRLLPIDNDLQKELFDSWALMVGADIVTRQPADEDHIRQLLEFPERDEDTIAAGQGDGGNDTDDDDDSNDDDEGQQTDLSWIDAKWYSTVVPGRVPLGPAVDDEPNDVERASNLAEIEKILDDVEEAGRKGLEPIFRRIERGLIKRIQRDGYVAELPTLGKTAMRRVFDQMFTEGFEQGRASGKRDVPRATQEPQDPITWVAADEALEALLKKSFFITGILSDKILSEAREAIFQSIKQGETTQGAVNRLRTVLGDGLFSPQRLETIVRTNTTEAFNIGRLHALNQSPLIDQVMFSAILDTRTTEVCRYMHGRTFRKTDPALQRFLPPLHFNCRSIIVPVPPSLERSPDDLITEEQKGRGFELAQEGFI